MINKLIFYSLAVCCLYSLTIFSASAQITRGNPDNSATETTEEEKRAEPSKTEGGGIKACDCN